VDLVRDSEARSQFAARARARSPMFDARLVQATIEQHYRQLARF
jgi:hypothetical protein